MNLVIFGIFVLCLVAIQFTGGKTVDEIVEKYIRAIGGVGRLEAIKSIYSEGLITIMGSTLSIKIYQFKEDIHAERYSIQWRISDLADNQYQTLQSTFSTQLLDREIIECLTQSGITGHLINYIAEGNNVILVGKELVEDTACSKIALTTKTGAEINYWFNSSGGLLYQTATRHHKSSAVKMEWIRAKYTEYKPVQNVLTAHKIEIILAGNPASIEVNFNKILINEPFEANFVNTYNQP